MVQSQSSLAVTNWAASLQLAVSLLPLPVLWSTWHLLEFIHETAARLGTDPSSFNLSPHAPCFHRTSKLAQRLFIPAHLSVRACIHLYLFKPLTVLMAGGVWMRWSVPYQPNYFPDVPCSLMCVLIQLQQSRTLSPSLMPHLSAFQ